MVAATGARADLIYAPVVTVVGDNAGALTTDTGYTTTISIYAPSVASQASPLSSTTYANTGSGSRLVTGFNSSEGLLTNNPGVSNAAATGVAYAGTEYVYNGGYNANTGTAAIQSSGTNAQRSFGQTNVTNSVASGAVVLQTRLRSEDHNNNLRGAVADDSAATRYTSGDGSSTVSGGWRNFTTNSVLSTAPINTRSVELLGSGLYGSTGSATGAGLGIHLINPSGTPDSSLYLGTGTGSSPYEFALFDDPSLSVTLNNGFDTAYVADDRTTASGGIQKYTWNGTIWTLAYTLKDAGLTAPQYRGLAGQLDVSTGLFTLFTSVQDSTMTRLQQVTDSGALSSFTTLASLTTSSGSVFRGVALTSAVPEASAFFFGGLVCCALGLTKYGPRLWSRGAP